MSTGTELVALDSKWNLGCLVRVKAQVMARDDSTGMWVPLSGGGMSVVSLHRVLTPRADNDGDDVTYVILGQRIADRSMALNCELLTDFQYTSVNPTFHHWTTNDKRFGLTFQTSSDATAFLKTIQRLQQKMKLVGTGSESRLDVNAEEVCAEFPTLNSASNHLKESENNESPMTKDRSSLERECTPKTSPRMPPCITPQIFVKQPHSLTSQIAHLRNNSSSDVLSQVSKTLDGNTSAVLKEKTGGLTLGDYGFYVDVSANSVGVGGGSQTAWLEGETKDARRKVGRLSVPSEEGEDLIYFSGSYVQFAKNTDPDKHEYCYPSLDSFKFPPYGTMPRAPCPESQKSHLSTSVPVPIPIKSRRRWLKWKKSCPPPHRRSPKPVRKLRCIYCDEFFAPDENHRGACKDAPDRILACIKAATCVCCRDAVLYHCKDDEDSEMRDETTDCGGFDGRRIGCRRRVMLILICLVVPCLWCYLPLRACHRLGTACHCCGPRHREAR